MKKISFKSIIIIGLVSWLVYECDKYKAREPAEFTVTDVSKEAFFIDSVSAFPGYHSNVSVSIVGTLDSSASVQYASYPKNYDGYTYELKKGTININTKYDYYGGDTLWIKFIPKGCKKGHLKIRTRVN